MLCINTLAVITHKHLNICDFYPQKEEFFIAALLPSYLERSGSSLIRMAQDFINHSPDQDSGFFLDNLELFYEIGLRL